MRYQYQLLAYFKVMQEKIISNGYGIKGKIKNGSKEIKKDNTILIYAHLTSTYIQIMVTIQVTNK